MINNRIHKQFIISSANDIITVICAHSTNIVLFMPNKIAIFVDHGKFDDNVAYYHDFESLKLILKCNGIKCPHINEIVSFFLIEGDSPLETVL